MAEKLIFTFHEMQVCYQKTLVPHPIRRVEHYAITFIDQQFSAHNTKSRGQNPRHLQTKMLLGADNLKQQKRKA